MFPLHRILYRSVSFISNTLHRVAARKATTETTAMDVNYLDLFLAFLGMTFGGISALPGLFFQPTVEADRKQVMSSSPAVGAPAPVRQRKSFVRNS